MTPDMVRLARRLAVPVAVLALTLSAAGAAVNAWPVAPWPYPASGAGRWAARIAVALGAVSVAVPPAVLVVAGMRLGYRRWREGVFLITAMLVAALALVVAQVSVPGATFPATATGLAAATYGGMAVVAARRLRTRWRRRAGAAVPAALVVAVAVGQVSLRTYRPDEVALSLLAGLAAVGIGVRYVLLSGGFEQRPAVEIPPVGRRRAAVIVNPTKVADLAEERRAVDAYMAAVGWAQPMWLVTRRDELGVGYAERAAAEGIDVVFACGGDGTIMSVLSGLAGTGVPLAILPAGTGNLLARNLALPQDRDACLRIGLHGADRKIDVGRVGEHHRFAVMAGMGLDAAMISDAPARLKARVGWPAYVVSAVRHLFDHRMQITVTVDDDEPVTLRARGVVIGNVGRLQAGMVLMPAAAPDDGVLDAAVLVPKGLRHWLALSWHVIRRRPAARGASIRHFRGRHIRVVSDRPWPRQIDGDLLEPGTEMTALVEPKALVVRIPAGPRAAA